VSPEAPQERRETVAHVWYVDFLELSNGDIYVGSTDDLRRRVASHQQRHVVSTSKYTSLVRGGSGWTDGSQTRAIFQIGFGKGFCKKTLFEGSRI